MPVQEAQVTLEGLLEVLTVLFFVFVFFCFFLISPRPFLLLILPLLHYSNRFSKRNCFLCSIKAVEFCLSLFTSDLAMPEILIVYLGNQRP